MKNMRILFLGFGDLAYRCAQVLDEYTLYGIARSAKSVPEGLTLVQGAVTDANLLAWVGKHHWDVVIITLTPSGRGESAYRQAYVESCQALSALWATAQKPNHVIYVSSTGVYAQDDGAWVNEESPALACGDSSVCLREAESIITTMGRALGIACSIVRFSGIYGPGRDFVVRQVLAGKAGGEAITNRIHQDDCAGFLAHLVHRLASGDAIEALYLASDSSPCTGKEVRSWMADYLGVSFSEESISIRAGNKRCDNSKMLASGYCLRYPSYKEGYTPMLSALNDAKKKD